MKLIEVTIRQEIDNISKIAELRDKRTETLMQNLKDSIKEAERKLETIKYNKDRIDRLESAETNKHRDLKEYYVHNFKKFKNGVTIIKREDNNYIRVPTIPKYRYKKNKKMDVELLRAENVSNSNT